MTGRTGLPGAVTIADGLNGPARTANGGVAAGTMARLVDGPAEVRLSSPPPMGSGLSLDRDDPWIVARGPDGAEVMRVRAVQPPDPEVPAVDATTVSDGRPYPDHPAATCVVCGPDRPDGLGLFPEPVPGHPGVMGTWWTPPDWAIDGTGHLRGELLWGVLDCPGALAIMQAADEPTFAALVGMTGEVRAPVRAGERVLVLGFTGGGAEGRKRFPGTAVLDGDGVLRAHTSQVCVTVPPAWARGEA